MFEDEIKKYYDTLAPSDKTKNALIKKVREQRRKQAVIKLVYEGSCSAAACFLLALGINTVGAQGNAEASGSLLASVISSSNGYVFAGILFAILLALFVTAFVKNARKRNDGNGDDKNEGNGKEVG